VVTTWDWESCRWKDVGQNFRTRELSLKRCGSQLGNRRVVVGEMWITSLDWESCRWRPVGHKFVLEELSLETCG
jgi:hypothetical protein